MDLVDAIYELSARFPGDEKFGLTSQIRCAAVSVPSNVAEGYGRQNRGDYIRHLVIVNGSLKEVETQIIVPAARASSPARIRVPPGTYARKSANYSTPS